MRRPGQVLGRRVIKKIRRYMLWDCSSCGTKGINANTAKQCPHCGNPKEIDDHREREYRSSTMVNENYKHRGADISCRSCGSENKHRFSCRNCGDALDPRFQKQVEHFAVKTDDDWRHQKVQVDEHGYVPDAADTPWDDGAPITLEEPTTHLVREAPRERPEPPPVPRMKPGKATRVREAKEKTLRTANDPKVNRNPLVWIAVAAVLTLIAVSGIWLYTKANNFFVTGATPVAAEWSYSLPLEDYAARHRSHTVEDGDYWSLPSDAFNESSERVFIREEPIYEDVWVTKTCQRTEDDSYTDTDGTWVEVTVEVDYDCSGYENQHVGDEDIWGTRWEYYVMRWENTTPLTASAADQRPRFPEFTPTETLRIPMGENGEPVAPEVQYRITFTYVTTQGNGRSIVRELEGFTFTRVRLHYELPAIINGLGSLRAIQGIDEEYAELQAQSQ